MNMKRTDPAICALLALALSAPLSGCGGANMDAYTPVHRETKYPEDSLFIASRDAAERLGYVARTSDPASHLLDTREKQVATSSVPRRSYKYSFHVDTSGGVLAITAECSQNSATNEDVFTDCGDERPERVVKELAALEKEILATAKNVESHQNTDWGALDESKPHPSDDADDGKADEKADKKADKADKKADKADKKADKADKKADKADKKADEADKKADKKANDEDEKSDGAPAKKTAKK